MGWIFISWSIVVCETYVWDSDVMARGWYAISRFEKANFVVSTLQRSDYMLSKLVVRGVIVNCVGVVDGGGSGMGAGVGCGGKGRWGKYVWLLGSGYCYLMKR